MGYLRKAEYDMNQRNRIMSQYRTRNTPTDTNTTSQLFPYVDVQDLAPKLSSTTNNEAKSKNTETKPSSKNTETKKKKSKKQTGKTPRSIKTVVEEEAATTTNK